MTDDKKKMKRSMWVKNLWPRTPGQSLKEWARTSDNPEVTAWLASK